MYRNERGFTLIELLVVIAVIGILASVILASLGSARTKARDAQRKASLKEMANAMELYRSDNSQYIESAGWVANGTLAPLVPNYISKISSPPSGTDYQYWRKDYAGYSCMTLGNSDKYAFYAVLENPTATEIATLTGGDTFDQCVRAYWGMNYKVGN